MEHRKDDLQLKQAIVKRPEDYKRSKGRIGSYKEALATRRVEISEALPPMRRG
jgi:hypothetical protein